MVIRYSIRPDELVNVLPPAWGENVQQNIQSLLMQSDHKLVVLHDAPGGTYTIPGTAITLQRDTSAFIREFKQDKPIFNVLMNSRSLNYKDATALDRYVAHSLRYASENMQQPFTVMSHGDSTLHGYFPYETQTLMQTLGGGFDGVLFMPADENSITLEGTHYIKHDGEFVLAEDSPFAKNAAFGYRASDLRAWLEEKSNGHIAAQDVQLISLETIRYGGPEAVYNMLLTLEDSAYCVVDCVSQRDADVVALAVHMAQLNGKRFMYRVGTRLSRAMAGDSAATYIEKRDLALGKGVGGLMVIGSRTPSATQQLISLLASDAVIGIEVRVESLLHDESQEAEVARCSDILESALQQGDVVLYTSRRIVGTEDPAHSQIITQRINAGLTAIINGIIACPRYIAVKGSVTATDIAIRALNIRRAVLMGELMPGVPVWTIGNGGTSLPKISYMIVPGNVGDANLLTDIVLGLR